MVATTQLAQALVTEEDELGFRHPDFFTGNNVSLSRRKGVLAERAGEECTVTEKLSAENQLLFFLHRILYLSLSDG